MSSIYKTISVCDQYLELRKDSRNVQFIVDDFSCSISYYKTGGKAAFTINKMERLMQDFIQLAYLDFTYRNALTSTSLKTYLSVAQDIRNRSNGKAAIIFCFILGYKSPADDAYDNLRKTINNYRNIDSPKKYSDPKRLSSAEFYINNPDLSLKKYK